MATDSPGGPASSVDRVAQLARTVVDHLTATQDRLPVLGGARPDAGAPHLWQLDRVIRTARMQAEQIELRGPAGADPQSDLWRLREPGYLREISEHPVVRPNGVLVLVPVALTWLILGIVEFRYASTYTDIAVDQRPPFFADWIAAPFYRGPVALAGVIVLSIVWIMYGYGQAKRAQDRADALDVGMQQLEAQLYDPLTELRALVTPPRSDDLTSRAADALFHASVRIDHASDQLVGSVELVDRLGSMISRLVAAVPKLEEQATQLAGLDDRFRQTAAQVADSARPVVELGSKTAGAATAATEAAIKSEAAVTKAAEQIVAANQLGERTAEFGHTLAEAKRPFVDAAGTVARAAAQLDQTSELLAKTVDGMRQTIDQVNWLALVADGLRDGDVHRPAGRS